MEPRRKERRAAALNNHLTTQTLLDFDLGESSSDSDFLPPEQDDSEDDFNTDDEVDSNKDESGSEESSDSELGLGEKKSQKNEAVKEQVETSAANLINLLESGKTIKKNENTVNIPRKPICCACLGDRSDDSNEIVECDGCGVTVHEGCYGISESNSVSSTASSCSTEPWFCEVCRAGLTDPECELCPNQGGVFKETDCGRWVHLVCALYVPGVAFGDVDNLSSVTLFEMQYSRWGAKTCSLCEDSKFAHTGVCIGCDAGMCKTHFHVTCAQSAGFLSEAHSDEVDPFYAHCKLHSDKTLVKKRKRNFFTWKLQHQQRVLEREAKKTEPLSLEQQRIERKLKKHRAKYLHLKTTKPDAWVPTQKMPRLLTTSASAVRALIFKTELMGINAAALEFEQAQIAELTDIRKKWHIPPAFSVEFVGYYLDRTNRIEEIKKNLQEQITLNKRLVEDQQTFRNRYSELLRSNEVLSEKNLTLKTTIEKLHYQILALCPNKQLTVVDNIGKPTTSPKLSPVQAPVRKMAVPTAAALKMGVGFPLNNFVPGTSGETNGRVLSTQCIASSLDAIVNECGICKKVNDQHLLAKCDICKLFYHLGCLNPPLTRHPKKSKLYGWQCSECVNSDDSAPEIIPKQPRRSRTRYSKDGSIVLISLDESYPLDFKSGSEKSKSGTNTPRQIKSPRKSDAKLTNGPLNGPITIKNGEDLSSISNVVENLKPIKRKSESLNEKLEITAAQKRKSNISSTTCEITQEAPKSPLNLPLDLSRQISSPTKKSQKIKMTVHMGNQCIKSEILNSSNPVSPTDKNHHEENNTTKKRGRKKKKSESLELSMKFSSVDAPFLSNESQFNLSSTTSSCDPPNTGTNVLLVNGVSDSVPHKSRKKRKDKHKNKNEHESEASTSKEHKIKRKRKKKHLDIEKPKIEIVGLQNCNTSASDEKPRIKLKFKAIPRPEGQPISDKMPKLFYVPTDSNDQPPEFPLNNQASRTNSTDSQEEQMTGIKTAITSTPLLSNHHCTSAGDIVSSDSKITQRARKRILSPSVDINRSKSASILSPNNSLANNSLEVNCDVCHQLGNAQNLVRCDECLKNYHLLCLEPPLKKTPKRRGYSWHCADCDPTDTENNK